MAKAPLSFVFYIAAPIEKVWNRFVSKEANRTIFMGADFDMDLKPGGATSWSGPGKDGKPTRYVTGKVLRVEAPNLLEYKFAMGEGTVMSRVRVELAPETEAVKVVVTNDEWADQRSGVHAECGRVAADSFAIEDTPGDGEDISTALKGKFGHVWGLSSSPSSQRLRVIVRRLRRTASARNESGGW